MIPYGRHEINTDDIAAVSAVLASDWLTTGPLVEEFEQALEAVVGAPCIAVSSGTAALHCAYAAIGLGPGDEVITPPITFIATQATAAQLGAKIVFADIQSDTGNINPQAVAAAVTSRTKAIVAVDYAGHPADLDELRAIADRHSIFLIEDAAHSLGSRYKGRPVGSIADLTTFSFFPTKNMTTAEGGAVASLDPALLERAKRFSRQGLVRNPEEFKISNQGIWHQEVHEFGLNYRLPDVLCALGISQLNRLQTFKNQRSEVFANYNEALCGIEGLELPSKRDYVDPMWHLYPIKVPDRRRKEIFCILREAGILVQVNYLPANQHPVFESLGYKASDTPEAQIFYSREISLPMMANPRVLDHYFFEKIKVNLRIGLKGRYEDD
jgi:dTDP-4-amino-4,6-dideoxygalactose transaminase